MLSVQGRKPKIFYFLRYKFGIVYFSITYLVCLSIMELQKLPVLRAPVSSLHVKTRNLFFVEDDRERRIADKPPVMNTALKKEQNNWQKWVQNMKTYWTPFLMPSFPKTNGNRRTWLFRASNPWLNPYARRRDWYFLSRRRSNDQMNVQKLHGLGQKNR